MEVHNPPKASFSPLSQSSGPVRAMIAQVSRIARISNLKIIIDHHDWIEAHHDTQL